MIRGHSEAEEVLITYIGSKRWLTETKGIFFLEVSFGSFTPTASLAPTASTAPTVSAASTS